MDMIDIILELEGGELIINNDEDMKAVLNVAETFKNSQGFYSRLYGCIRDFLADPEHQEAYPLSM